MSSIGQVSLIVQSNAQDNKYTGHTSCGSRPQGGQARCDCIFADARFRCPTKPGREISHRRLESVASDHQAPDDELIVHRLGDDKYFCTGNDQGAVARP